MNSNHLAKTKQSKLTDLTSLKSKPPVCRMPWTLGHMCERSWDYYCGDLGHSSTVNEIRKRATTRTSATKVASTFPAMNCCIVRILQIQSDQAPSMEVCSEMSKLLMEGRTSMLKICSILAQIKWKWSDDDNQSSKPAYQAQFYGSFSTLNFQATSKTKSIALTGTDNIMLIVLLALCYLHSC